ncbi:hypothetical protein OEZ60_21335 [Defluviimonas sp. WL0024]|uniref:Cytochrome c domain-containing protein n=1 Tax=Albidovulum salinarum TaxID=2984153 RepID=A0ABT2X999_9RHOB|nr:hypothetical protein [Defluviimonas sp. WL0024]MCU9850526.1 hypothetical protein [Defluviimonas sp. WL0024]
MTHIRNNTTLGAAARPACLPAGIAAGLGMLMLSIAPETLNAGELPASAAREAPATLFETGLYSEPARLTVDPAHIAFAPQYPLWTDGAEKHRWIALPPGSAIDASDPDGWDFPIGTQFWKEFSFEGRKVETRYMERLADGSWLFATYAWSEDQRSADLVSGKGRKGAHPLAGGASHTIPGVTDCRACHMSGPVPVLGFGARQLATDDDPHVLRGDPAPRRNRVLDALVARGVVVGLDPRIIAADPPGRSQLERDVLGYLHGNCGHCHNSKGPLGRLGLDLRQSVSDPHARPLVTTLGQPLKSPPPGLTPGTVSRVEPGRPDLSALPQRMASRWPVLQMPPLGTTLVDVEAVDLINRWIAEVEMVSAEARHEDGEEE